MTFDEACTRYFEWAEQFPNDPAQPNRNLSQQDEGIWHLENVNGPLVAVTSDGSVVSVRPFWSVYERLAAEGKCDSPGGMEYRRVLTEWIEEQPDNMDEFICRRANVGP